MLRGFYFCIMTILTKQLWFPDPKSASEDGLLAIGGDLSLERLKLAYKSGIFPWYSQGGPILWYSPDPRMVLFPPKLKISKSLGKILDSKRFKITFNQHFEDVIANCKYIERKDQPGTWITDEMQASYIELHKQGWAKSVEVWLEGQLVGGLYGIDLGTIFCGESMFSFKPNASKVGFAFLVEQLLNEQYKLIDCQVYTKHLASLGAEEISRSDFLKYL